MKRLFLILFKDGGHDLQYLKTKANGEPQEKPKGFVELVDVYNYVNCSGSLGGLAFMADLHAREVQNGIIRTHERIRKCRRFRDISSC